MRALLVGLVIVLASARAYAYPQFQLSRDQTCTGCHVQPDGGGLLNENGLATAEAISQFGTNPEFMYGAIHTPDWLALNGDLRGMWGYLQTPQRYLVGIPMQADVTAAATYKAFSLQATVGMRPAQEDNEALTRVWSREHYVQWQREPGNEGLYVRLGRFMPVFGLRFVEHPIYTRRFGGTPLFSDTYGVSASYVRQKYEGHVTGFVRDPLIDPVQRANGGALYGEYRITETTQVGAGAMVEISDYDQKYRGEITAKKYLPGPDILLQAELQLVNPHVGQYGYRQLVGYAMGTWFPMTAWMIDVGFGHYDENLRIKNLDRDAFDLNVHWFATSHIEASLVARYELIGWGSGGPSGAYVMLQGHYRL